MRGGVHHCFHNTKIMKYIIGDLGSSQLTTALVFHEGIEHITFKDVFVPGTIISAGFCSIQIVNGVVDVHAYSESKSLGVVSNPEQDEKIIKRAIQISVIK